MVSFVELLGIQIDDKLSFNLHISNICMSAANQLNALIRLKRFLGFKEKRILINTYLWQVLITVCYFGCFRVPHCLRTLKTFKRGFKGFSITIMRFHMKICY